MLSIYCHRHCNSGAVKISRDVIKMNVARVLNALNFAMLRGVCQGGWVCHRMQQLKCLWLPDLPVPVLCILAGLTAPGCLPCTCPEPALCSAFGCFYGLWFGFLVCGCNRKWIQCGCPGQRTIRCAQAAILYNRMSSGCDCLSLSLSLFLSLSSAPRVLTNA